MNHSRPALRATRNFGLPDERDHRKQDSPQFVGPSVRLSPLVEPRGESNENMLRDCGTCAVRSQCRPEKFALDACEMQISKRKYMRTGSYTRITERRQKQAQAILAEIRLRRIFTVQDVALASGLHYSTVKGHIAHLVTKGVIRFVRRDGKAIIYALAEAEQ